MIRALVLISLVAACAPPAPPVLHPQVQQGPAAGARPNRVIVVHAACGAVEARCPRSYIEAVDAIVRGGLEFSGYHVVEAEGLRAETRQRHEEHETTTTTTDSAGTVKHERTLAPDDTTLSQAHSASTTEHSVVVLDGSSFEDLSVDDRRTVLDKSGADAVVSVRIVVGGQLGVWVPNQTVEVMVKLGVNLGDSMAWASRCSASSNDFSTVDAALEHAARCAIHGAK